MIEMSSGIGATAMGIGVSHGTGGGEGVAGGCRLRAQSQSQASGSTTQHNNPQQSSQQQQQQQQQQPPSSQQQQQQQPQQRSGIMGRSKKDNCCLCWCCSCLCLAAIGGNSAGADGAGDQGKKKGNASVGVGGGGGVGEHRSSVAEHAGAGNGLDGLDGIDGSMECSVDEVRTWGSSFEKMMRHTAGRELFREFLRSEFSEENIAFWMACEQLKRENDAEMVEKKAQFIYKEYISTDSSKEVSLDSRVREIVNHNMTQPTPHTFDEAQQQIYTLMQRDSYPRFVNSDIYRRMARLDNGPPSATNDEQQQQQQQQQQNITGKSKGKKGAT
ncbi:PREDICTED: regulator of G-protein signaling 17 isoform X2 [Dufourea novaeangliae]|nr:PREDICTED: regulator of G-protein signaling 17 isoform X2 [Dufourea novaeangliae]